MSRFDDPPILDCWRYMNLSALIETLRTSELRLTRADTFDDPWEGHVNDQDLAHAFMSPDPMRILWEHRNYESGGRPRDMDTHRISLFMMHEAKAVLQNSYVSCWHRSLNESMAMWKIYGAEDTVATRVEETDLHRLTRMDPSRQRIPGEIVVNSVRYVSHRAPIGALRDPLAPLFTKTAAFEYEREVRVVLAQPIPLLPESEAPVVHPDPKKVPDDEHLFLRLGDMELGLLFARHIVISPFAPEGFDERVRTEISKTGNFARVFPSELGPPGR